MGDIIRFKPKENSRTFTNAYIERWIFEDTSLSWAAKGLLAYLLAVQHSDIRVKDTTEMCPEEFVPQMKRAIQELTEDYINIV